MNDRYYVGQKLSFYCNGRGRGGHLVVHAEVTKIKRATLECVETPVSYKPGTEWTVHEKYLDDHLTARGMTTPGYNEWQTV